MLVVCQTCVIVKICMYIEKQKCNIYSLIKSCILNCIEILTRLYIKNALHAHTLLHLKNIKY